jgi:TRAP-type C4-dicarboxylate transport system substrate-binding protein
MPVLMSMRAWNRLSPEQRAAFQEAAEEMYRDWIPSAYNRATEDLIKAFSEAGVKIHYMTKDEFETWLAFAKRTAWKRFEEKVSQGKELLDLAEQAME